MAKALGWLGQVGWCVFAYLAGLHFLVVMVAISNVQTCFFLTVFFWERRSQMEFNSTVQPLKANQLANEIHAPCSFHSWQRDEIIDD